MRMGELAFTSFDTNLKQFTKRSDSEDESTPTKNRGFVYMDIG